MPMYDYKYLLCEGQVLGNAGDEAVTSVIDFGSASPDIAKDGKFGLHVVVTILETQTALNSGAIIWICGSDSDTTPDLTDDRIIGRFFVRGDMLAGKHYFIPCPPIAYRYMTAYFDVVSENGAAGAYTIWFGPGPDGGV